MAENLSTRRAKTVRLREVLDRLGEYFPATLAEDWDNVGLLVGSPDAAIRRIGVALEPSLAAVRQTAGTGDSLLITHHPLLLKQPKTLDLRSPLGRIIETAIKRGVAIAACHTNADWAENGVNDVLVETLGFKNARPWREKFPVVFKKLVVFVPESHLTPVSEAIFKAGGGRIGNYAKCSFRHPGEGTYLPLAGADPFAGRVGEVASEPEIRLEVRVPTDLVTAVLGAMHAAHPYEEVVFDLLPTERQSASGGVARLADLPKPLPLAMLGRQSARRLGSKTARLIGDPEQTIGAALVCGGAGSFLIEQLAGQKNVALITGDVKYHEALTARDLGVPVLDLGHYATERPFAEALATRLARQFNTVKVFACRPEGDPFTAI